MDMSRVQTTAWIAAILFSSLAGCRQNAKLDVYIDSLNNEKRLLEDEVYRLEYENNSLQARLERYQGSSNATGNTGDVSVGAGNSGGSSQGSLPEPVVDEPEVDSPSIEVPMIESGESVDPSELELDFSQFQHLPGAGVAQASAEIPVAAAQMDTRITHIWLNSQVTGGHNFDRNLGDEGVAVLIEPRNANDQFVPLGGDVTVRLFDPSLPDNQIPIDQWEIVADEIAHRIRTLPLSARGVYLLLPWSSLPPAHADLVLQVRLVTDDGRSLETSREIHVRLPGDTDLPGSWTPRVSDILDMAPKTMAELTEELRRGQAEPTSLPADSRRSPPPRRIEPPRELFSNSKDKLPVDNSPGWKPTRE